MPTVRVKANCPEGKFLFYAPKGEPGRRYRDGEIFNFEYDDSRPIEKQISKWMDLMEKPKGKPGPKPKTEQPLTEFD